MAIASNGRDTPILDHLATLSDSVRSRILVLLGQELTVGDLCSVLQLPQSTVSRHLKFLSDRSWVDSRPDGTHRLYRRTLDAPGHDARDLWDMVRASVEKSAAGAADRERLASVLASRKSRSREFFDKSAGDWDSLRDELFGPHFHGLALLGLLPASWTVADLGCGTGAVAEALAPFVSEVIGVDASPAMLQGA
ncbi:MAG: metalloregulator ArsR/SmtB family transcription factor, partial [Gemmatimonadetes bacterium]|nr:metalloregulator ArsR/SmtB family transcription factor [Gemmatimonadota bacterium]